jgi:hypothetical protein
MKPAQVNNLEDLISEITNTKKYRWSGWTCAVSV